MAVQFNLLPDVKLEFNRQQKAKHFVYTVSFLASAIVLAIFVISFLSVNVLQKKLLSDAQDDITTNTQKLKNIPDLEKVLTIQNQLNTLPKLHQTKHISSRFFSYLPQITPSKVFVGQISLDLAANAIIISGTSDKLATINTLIDTLKFTTIKIGDQEQQTPQPAFTNVVLTSSSRSDKSSSYSINANFDPILFDGTQTVSLIVPKEITTRSVREAPDINNLLFNGETGTPKNQGGQ
jgi:Tfp pilus assembly protein PilN